MSVRAVTCPGCGINVNVPIAMANVKCPSCSTVWNVNQPSAAQRPATAKRPATAAAKSDDNAEKGTGSQVSVAMMAAMVGGGLLLFTVVGVAAVLMTGDSSQANSSSDAGNSTPTASQGDSGASPATIKPAVPEEYRIIRLPEATRRRIYDDYRKVARTSVETPLMAPQGTRLRQATEGMLQGVFDRELARFAALHDITVDDVKEVIKEGDAKGWDPTPRSNAVRNGQRVYSPEMSEGWERNPNRN